MGPRLRRRLRVEMMLFTALVAIGIAGIGAAWSGRITAGILLAALVNAAAAIGRLAIEATVQSGAPDANRGRAFARFETQNQMAWVAGGLIPVIFAPSGWVGFAIVGAAGVVGATMYVRRGAVTIGFRAARAKDRARRSR
jgi:hypothetical protein